MQTKRSIEIDHLTQVVATSSEASPSHEEGNRFPTRSPTMRPSITLTTLCASTTTTTTTATTVTITIITLIVGIILGTWGNEFVTAFDVGFDMNLDRLLEQGTGDHIRQGLLNCFDNIKPYLPEKIKLSETFSNQA